MSYDLGLTIIQSSCGNRRLAFVSGDLRSYIIAFDVSDGYDAVVPPTAAALGIIGLTPATPLAHRRREARHYRIFEAHDRAAISVCNL